MLREIEVDFELIAYPTVNQLDNGLESSELSEIDTHIKDHSEEEKMAHNELLIEDESVLEEYTEPKHQTNRDNIETFSELKNYLLKK